MTLKDDDQPKVVADTPEGVGLCDTAGPVEKVRPGSGTSTPLCLAQTCPDVLRSFVEECNKHTAKFRMLLRDTAVSGHGAIVIAQEMNAILDTVTGTCRLRMTDVKRSIVRNIGVLAS